MIHRVSGKNEDMQDFYKQPVDDINPAWPYVPKAGSLVRSAGFQSSAVSGGFPTQAAMNPNRD